MNSAKLSSKFQLSIPKAVRDNLQLQAGQQFVLLERGHIIELVPVQTIQQMRGMLSGVKATMDYRDRQERKPI
ncbi:MAG: AbrB/MazE/SpoVT family DNA-binding domain-containing protein [Gammaproteobacteria bacterium]|nr:AbrB/MazE/SpoVT family DNA-binding domain-containing protein [Gammaproteobacteria bacterium]